MICQVVAIFKWSNKKKRSHDDADRPHVALLVVLAFDDFGRHEPPCAGGALAVGHSAGKAEVDGLDAAASIDVAIVNKHKVFGLEIAMHDALLVQEQSHIEHAANQQRSFFLGVCLMLAHTFDKL